MHYPWGKPTACSLAASLATEELDDFMMELPSAELWIGDHPKAPSNATDLSTKKTTPLDKLLTDHPDIIQSPSLPFLFKVLSINKTLSMQVHPAKPLAEELHRTCAQHYPDGNHKPEFVIAVSSCEAFIGFKPWHEMIALLGLEERPLQRALARAAPREYSELLETLCYLVKCHMPSNPPENLKQEARSSLRTLMHALLSNEEVLTIIPDLVKELSELETPFPFERLALRLARQHPGDPGCLLPPFLQFHRLSPGQVMGVTPGVPHSYVSGDALEVMARSDNVIRACLTTKHRDIEAFCRATTFEHVPSPIRESQIAPGVNRYHMGTEEFSALTVSVDAPRVSLPIREHMGQGPVLVAVIRGRATLTRGGEPLHLLAPRYVLLSSSEEEVQLEATPSRGVAYEGSPAIVVVTPNNQ
eukprot:gnl/Dysnectes_brevis/4024_a5255_625.p1 GENE.gnl/Dysnectes_brevis/4024_a5255_625~~gnl/Dysnectes_brevis/4024_a5255_625.p1  ORF type:complete len:434 (-),score=108.72 gnl/Dysnectes_brevis/4024_a5255_625:30-1277(-)